MNILLILVLLLVSSTPAAPPEIRAGRIVIHDAFPAVLRNFPERVDPLVDGYIGVTDCREIGERLVLVRAGQPDALVAVADCAWPQHVAYRRRMNYIADVDRKLWTGPERPQYAELWTLEARAAFWQERQEREFELRRVGR